MKATRLNEEEAALDGIMAMIATPEQNAKDALGLMKKLRWCLPKDEDGLDCPMEDSLAKVVAFLKERNLRYSMPVGKEKRTLLWHLMDRAQTCNCAYVNQTVPEIVCRAVQEAGLVAGVARAKDQTPELYYDRRSQKFWEKAADGVWQGINYDAAIRRLAGAGLSRKQDQWGGLSEAETELNEVSQHKTISHAGPLAGYPAGVVDFSGHRFLVTQGINLIEPRAGDCDTIMKIVKGMFGAQSQHVLATLKLGYESYRDNVDRPVPMLVLCGPASTDEKTACAFKSAFAKHVIIPFWGGRWADASRYILGKTEFNADLIGSETLFLDDVKPHGNWMSRHDFSEQLKSIVVGASHSLHAKGKDAIPARPRWRVVMTNNDDDEALRQMPDFAENFKDKAHLLKVNLFELPMPNRTVEEWLALDAQIKMEMPAFIDALLHWQVPTEIQSDRFGVKAHHHPELIEKLYKMSSEARLASLIEIGLMRHGNDEWSGTSEELKMELCQSQTVGRDAEKLLGWDGATGCLLGKLRKKEPKKYIKGWSDNGHEQGRKRAWTIHLRNLDGAGNIGEHPGNI